MITLKQYTNEQNQILPLIQGFWKVHSNYAQSEAEAQEDSDSHGTKERVCNMKKCYEYVAKKFGDDYAQEIMQTTPENIINGR